MVWKQSSQMTFSSQTLNIVEMTCQFLPQTGRQSSLPFLISQQLWYLAFGHVSTAPLLNPVCDLCQGTPAWPMSGQSHRPRN